MDDFLARALLGGVGVALAAGPLGAFIVWRRMAYFGDTLAHSGLLGIVLGTVLGNVASNMLGYAVRADVKAILYAVLFSTAIGVFFGYYPANKAVRISALEAIKASE